MIRFWNFIVAYGMSHIHFWEFGLRAHSFTCIFVHLRIFTNEQIRHFQKHSTWSKFFIYWSLLVILICDPYIYFLRSQIHGEIKLWPNVRDDPLSKKYLVDESLKWKRMSHRFRLALVSLVAQNRSFRPKEKMKDEIFKIIIWKTF